MKDPVESNIFEGNPYPVQAAAASGFTFHEAVGHKGASTVWAARLALLTPEDKEALQSMVAGSGAPDWERNRKVLRWMQNRGVTQRAFTYETFLTTSRTPLGTLHERRSGLVEVSENRWNAGGCDFWAHPSIFETRD